MTGPNRAQLVVGDFGGGTGIFFLPHDIAANVEMVQPNVDATIQQQNRQRRRGYVERCAGHHRAYLGRRHLTLIRLGVCRKAPYNAEKYSRQKL